MAEIKIQVQTENPTIEVGTNKKLIAGKNNLATPDIKFIATGSSGNKGDKGDPGVLSETDRNAINANTAKVGITSSQANAITANTAKNSYPSSDSTKLSGIESGAEVNVQANWNETDSNADSFIQNKPTIPTDTNTTYTVSCVDGDNTDEEKIRLTDSSGTNDDIVLEAGTGLSIARSGDKITFTNTVVDTDTVLTTEQVQDVVGAMFTSNTETRVSATYDDNDGTIDLVVDDMTADTNTQLTTEQVQDIIGAMVDGGTETNISVTYDDTSGKLNFVSTDTNTTYSEATGSAEGLMSIAHHDKLDGIETSADVTDTANVTAAGALMDSELTDLAGVKGVTISTLQVKPSEGAFANGDKTKLNGIATGATANIGDVTLTGTQTLSGNKTLNNLRVQNEETDGGPEIRFYEGSDNGTNYASLKASDSIASNYEVALPTSAGTIQLQPSEGAFANGDKTKLDAIESGATADQTQADINSLNVTAASCTGNAATATALTSGNKTIDGDLTIDGNNITNNATATNFNIASSRILELQHAGVYDIQLGNSTNVNVLKVSGSTEVVTVNGALNVTGIITGKQREIYSQSFLDDLGTTKHYLPWKDINEQTTIYQEEAAMLMPCDGRIVSVTVRTASVTGNGNMTIGVNTIAPNINSFGSANWTEEETETLAVSSADDYHVFHFAFDNAKHFDSGDLVSLSIQNDTDLSSNTYWYVSTVVEYDWSTFLGTTSAEHDSNP